MKSAFRTLSIYDRIVIQNQKLTEESLSEEFEVSTRTIDRTIKAINRYIYPKRIRKHETKKYFHVVLLNENEMYS